MASKVLISDCALCYVRLASGGIAQVFYGDRVPEGYDEADVQRLQDEGFLREAREDEIGGLVALQDVSGGQVPGKDDSDQQAGSTAAPAGAPESVNERSTHDQLDAYAAAQTPPVDLSGASTKAEKLDAIQKAAKS